MQMMRTRRHDASKARRPWSGTGDIRRRHHAEPCPMPKGIQAPAGRLLRHNGERQHVSISIGESISVLTVVVWRLGISSVFRMAAQNPAGIACG